MSSSRRRILVTGGGSRIGFAIAGRLARAGDHVVLASRSADRVNAACETLGAEGLSCSAHACDIRDPDAVARLFDAAGELDGLVNNAAGNFVCPSLELSPNGFRAVVESSLHGSFFCSQELARRAIARGDGATILDIVATDSARANILSDPDAEDRMRSLIPLDRFADEDEIADAAAWLLSDEASYCTGAVLTVDGGRSLGVAMHGVAART
jgi:NAD(P)-dependent dehydrogenase (short-subunit alcohol dehydrogenase family)